MKTKQNAEFRTVSTVSCYTDFMKDLSKEIILTERLRLVPLSENYAQEISENFTEEITLYMVSAASKKVEDTLEYIHKQLPKMKRGEDLHMVILDKETGEFLGGGGAHDLNTTIPQLGIWIKKTAHEKGYGREAVTALKQWLDENISYTYIKYAVDKKNIPSRKIAESFGGVVEDAYKKTNMSGNVLDEVEYRIYKGARVKG